MVYNWCMESLKISYSGRHIEEKDIVFIRDLISKHFDKSRWFISKELCRQWNWRQENGFLKDMSCRGLLLKLEREGYIIQPPRKRVTNNPFVNRKRPEPIEIDSSPITGTVKEIKPIEIISVRRTKYEKLYNSLLEQYHYLKYAQPVGENIKYIVFINNRPIACLGWMSPPWYIESRDKYIGWSKEARKKNLHFIAYNTRFIILPWVKISNLASYLLGLTARIISRDWENLYKHPIYFLETFVDTEVKKFKGTCYKAANWQLLGETKGRGRLSKTYKKTRSLKAVFGYPLNIKFREILCQE